MHQKAKQDRADFEQIAQGIGKLEPAISVFVVDTKQADWADPEFEQAAPTLTVSPMPIKRFAPPSGAVCQGHEFPDRKSTRLNSSHQ